MTKEQSNYVKLIWWAIIIGVVGLAFGWVWALIPLALFVAGTLWATVSE